jgi:hypothetical protein
MAKIAHGCNFLHSFEWLDPDPGIKNTQKLDVYSSSNFCNSELKWFHVGTGNSTTFKTSNKLVTGSANEKFKKILTEKMSLTIHESGSEFFILLQTGL